jgi:hypothetical protein
MDGMSYGATVDTSTGKIVIETSELGEDVVAQPMQLGSGSGFGVFNQSEKDLLSKKFYELGNIG